MSVGIMIFDSRARARAAQAVYLTVTAAELAPDELTRPLGVYSARSQALGLRIRVEIGG